MLSFTIATPQLEEYQRAAEELQKAWQGLGIAVSISALDDTALFAAVKDRSFDVLLAAERYGAIADPYPFWHSSQTSGNGLNISQFSSKAADDAIRVLRTSANAEARTAAYSTLVQEIATASPAVFLYQSTLPVVLPKHVHNSELRTVIDPSDRFGSIANWYIKSGLKKKD